MKDEKTNVMRIFDDKKLPYTAHLYFGTAAVSGMEVATALGEEPSRVFKTLVTVGRGGTHYTFVIPVNCELNLKAAARAVGDKSVSMIAQKELLPLTGYIHGGCSPIGMKKQFVTVIDESVLSLDTFCFSGGKIGVQIEAAPSDLAQILHYTTAPLTVGV